jgi:hypothetical protein
LKNYYSLILIAACLAVSAVPAAAISEEVTLSCYKIDPGRVILYIADAVKIIPVAGTIEQIWLGEKDLYYVAIREEEGSPVAYFGCIDPGSLELPPERKLPLEMKGGRIMRLFVKGDDAYFLCLPKNASEGESGTLYRVSMQGPDVSRTQGVRDVYVSGGDMVTITETGSAPSVAFNGVSIPLTIRGDLRIQSFVDGRLVFVTNGRETEIIDIRAGKDLYQYSSRYEYREPSDYDFMVQVKDERSEDSAASDMVLYKVFINGIESGRTGTGPAGVVKEFKNMLEPGHEYLVRLERWDLNVAKGRYERVNNILQPKICRVYIPLNRVIRLMVRFNGTDYTYDLQPVYR